MSINLHSLQVLFCNVYKKTAVYFTELFSIIKVNRGLFMAQTLKEEHRTAIIDSAKEEFLKKGYKDASMRSIANKAKMTVGNLYRYFKNKEDIIVFIVGDTLKEIDGVLKSLTSNSVSFETRVYNIQADTSELRRMLDSLADKLVGIFYSHKIEFKILMLHSKLNDEITEWFAKTIKNLINQSYGIFSYDHESDVLSKAYASSIFAGLREIFKDDELDAKTLKMLIKIYFHSYIDMLDDDIRKIGESL